MKCILLIQFLFIILSSCQTYQYLTVSGLNISQDSSSQFISDNDTLWVQYNFNGYNGPVNVSVYNKTSDPLYINWKKSAIILRGKAYSYYSSNQQLNGISSGTEFRYGNGLNSQSGTIQATIMNEEGMDFIPPGSMKEKSSLFLINGFLNDIPKETLKKRQLWGANKEFPRMWAIDFSENDSPIQLRSYLTLLTAGEDGKEFSMEHRFYVSQIFQTTLNPSSLVPIQHKGNSFYTSKTSGFTQGMGILVGVGLITGLGIAAGNGDK